MNLCTTVFVWNATVYLDAWSSVLCLGDNIWWDQSSTSQSADSYLGRITSRPIPLRIDTFKHGTISGERLHTLPEALILCVCVSTYVCVSELIFHHCARRLSKAPWFHWSTVERTVTSIWQQLTGYTQLLCLRHWYDDTNSYLDCPLLDQLRMCPWLLGAGEKCQSPHNTR